MEEDKIGKARGAPSLPANYVTIVELQKRWIEERQRKETERDDQERRLREEKEGDGPRNRRFSPRNHRNLAEVGPIRVWRRSEGDEKLGNLSVKGAGREISGRSRTGAHVSEGRRMSVAWQCVPEAKIVSVIEEGGEGKKTGGSGSDRMGVDVQSVPGAEIFHVNEENSHGRKIIRKKGDWVKRNVDVDGNEDRRLVWDRRSGSNTGNNQGNGMYMNVGIDVKSEKVHMGGGRGRSNNSSRKSNGMDMNVNVDGKLEKCLSSGICESSNRNNGMDGTVVIDKLEKAPRSDATGRSKIYSYRSNGMDKNVDADGKMEKVLSGATGESRFGSTGMNETVCNDGKLEKVAVSVARGRNINHRNKGNGMDRNVEAYGKLEVTGNMSKRVADTAGIDEKLEKAPRGDARGRSKTYNNKSNGMDRNVDADGKLEKVVSGATGEGSFGSKGMDETACNDVKLEKVAMGDARGRNVNHRNKGNGLDRNVDAYGKLEENGNMSKWVAETAGIDEKLEKAPRSDARGRSKTYNNKSNGMDRNVDADGKLEKVVSGATGEGSFGSKGMDETACNGGKLEKVAMGDARGRNFNYRNKSNGMNRNVDTNGKLEVTGNMSKRVAETMGIDEKLEEAPMGDARGISKTYSNKSNGMDRNVYADVKLEKVVSGATGESSFGSKGMDETACNGGKLEKVAIGDARERNINHRNKGNGMDRNVDAYGKLEENGDMSKWGAEAACIDVKLEKAPRGDARGRSKTYNNKSNGMDRNVDADGKLEKVVSGATGEGSFGSKGMDETACNDVKLEKVAMGDARGRNVNYRNKSNGMNRNVDANGKLEVNGNMSKRVAETAGIDEKLEKVPMGDAREISKTYSNKSNGMDRNVYADVKLEKVVSGATGESNFGSKGMDVKDESCNESEGKDETVGIDGKLEKVPMSYVRGRSNNHRNKSTWIVRNVNANGKSEKAPRSVARGESSHGSNGMDGTVCVEMNLENVPITGSTSSNGGCRMDMTLGIDGKLKEDLMSGAKEASSIISTGSNGLDVTVDTDVKLEKVLMSCGREGSSLSNNKSNTMDDTVGVDEKFENRERGEIRIIERRRCNWRSRAAMKAVRGNRRYNTEMMWVEKGEVSGGNAGEIQNSRGSSKGSE